MRRFIETISLNLFEAKTADVSAGFVAANQREARVWINPSHNDVMLLVGRYGEVRGCNAVASDTVYVWDASTAVHFTMKRAIWRTGLLDENGTFDASALPMWGDFYISHKNDISHDWSETFNVPISNDVVLFMNSETAFARMRSNSNFQRMIGRTISVD